MSTKAKPAKAVPAKKAPAKSPASKPPKEQPPELNIKVTKSAETTSLTGTGVLGYEIGSDEAGETHFRIATNNAGGFFSRQWIALHVDELHADWELAQNGSDLNLISPLE